LYTVNFRQELVLEIATSRSLTSPLISLPKYSGNPAFCCVTLC